jgi:hypothetical protein
VVTLDPAMSSGPRNLISAGHSGQGATASLASTATLALWNLYLHNLKEAPESESHSLRQILPFVFNELRGIRTIGM